ncbi:copper resistance CopC family protein [Paenibacillus gorillae]|uniref:copper resistance CopC family protein n=1 Tax=Paenibacillus gorillae TaxID=1243662 RepID=UPI0004B567F1|nr:copper resistance protein CopC [Paenibacillus gorillae]
MRLKMMASNIVVLLAALLILFPSAALAHSKLDSAVPADGETVKVSPNEITMTFNTKIEKLSKFKLLNEAAEEVKTGKSVVDGNTMSGDLPEKLVNGSYTVKWTIMGADGHTISGDYSFTVDTPAEEAPATATPEATPVPTTDPAEAPAVTPTEAPAVPDQASNNGNTSTTQNSDMALGPILVVAVVITVIALVAAILISRRRKG